MKLLNITIALALTAIAGTALSRSKAHFPHGAPGGTPPVTCPADDGASGAPAGVSAQRPTLLSGYTKTIITTLGCGVAGVSYGVGYPAATVLTAWTNAGWRTNHGGTATCSGSSPALCRIDNTTGFVVDGVDFSTSGGANFSFINSPAGIVQNSKFQSDTVAGIIGTDSASPGLTVQYNIIDGNSGGPGSTLISIIGGGTAVIQYNWMKNFPQHALEFGTPSGGTSSLTYKYNLIENGGMTLGAHLNVLQYGCSSCTSAATNNVQFNTVYQQPQVAGGEFFQFEGAVLEVVPFGNIAFQYNTMIAAGSNSVSYAVHGLCHSAADCNSTLSTVSGTAVANNNFFDITGAFGAFYPSTGSAMWTAFTLSNNWNMSTGAALGNNP